MLLLILYIITDDTNRFLQLLQSNTLFFIIFIIYFLNLQGFPLFKFVGESLRFTNPPRFFFTLTIFHHNDIYYLSLNVNVLLIYVCIYVRI